VIEIDGYSRNNSYDRDLIRDAKLKELGYTTPRIEEREVCNDLNNVIRVIECKVGELLDQ
jgi:very-short-patch-repair endonuclease